MLYIDGEMSQRLLKQRLTDEVRRSGLCPDTMHILSHEDISNFQPLNTPAGQQQIERQIELLGGIDYVWFDDVMSLIAGDMKDEESWRQTLPWVKSLTQRKIGQAWIHHTGHDTSRGYGSKTKEWQMDTVIGLAEVEREDTDVSFKLTFHKARERTPANRAEFAEQFVRLVNDRWEFRPADGGMKKNISPLGAKFFDALVNATIGNDTPKQFGCPTAKIEEWRSECIKLGLLDKDNTPKSATALFSKYKLELIAANRMACNETVAWTLPN